MSRRRKQLLGIGALTCLGAVALWHWNSAPHAPDVRTADFGEVIGFMGSTDYTRMYKTARADYARGVAARVEGVLLDRFYRLAPNQQSIILQTIALAMTPRLASDVDQTRDDLYRLVARHPPRVQALRTQLAIDLERHQQSRRP